MSYRYYSEFPMFPIAMAVRQAAGVHDRYISRWTNPEDGV